jgi:hypothetical protein
MLPKNDDGNVLISSYLTTYGEQISFHKRIKKITASGSIINAIDLKTALNKDIQDRTTMGISNKTISLSEIDK